MEYTIKNANGEIIGMTATSDIAHIFAQALRERNRDTDYTVHPV